MFFLPNAKDQPDHGIKFLRAGVVAINFMSWSRMHPFVGQTFYMFTHAPCGIPHWIFPYPFDLGFSRKNPNQNNPIMIRENCIPITGM